MGRCRPQRLIKVEALIGLLRHGDGQQAVVIGPRPLGIVGVVEAGCRCDPQLLRAEHLFKPKAGLLHGVHAVVARIAAKAAFGDQRAACRHPRLQHAAGFLGFIIRERVVQHLIACQMLRGHQHIADDLDGIPGRA